ncbi:MAG: hypothetical protein QOF58_2679 [Pseudonocardiales bacterium]|nr:hypothetical protein [Pseudonocardiales bacterium]
MRSPSAALAAVLVVLALGVPAGPAAAVDDTLVLTDSRTDVPTGVGLSRARVHNGDRLLIETRHRDLRRKAYGNHFTVWIDTRTSHAGPDFVISGGLSDGTDWATGRATTRWHTRIDPVDDIGLCNSGVDISWSLDKVLISLARDCLGGHQGRVRVAVQAGDEDYTDWAPARRTFSRWIPRG